MSLHEELRELTEDVPRQVRVDAAAAWATARRRRVRRTAGAVAAVVVVALVVVAGLRGLSGPVALDPADGSSGSRLELPARIDHPLGPVRDLPRKAGRIAGVVHRTDGDTNDRGWFAVSPTGRLWRIPGATWGNEVGPAVSADGSTIGYLQELAGDRTRLVLWHTVDGVLDVAPEVGNGVLVDGAPQVRTTYAAEIQAPFFLSPDGSTAFVSGWHFPDMRHDRALLVSGSGVRALEAPAGTRVAAPAGWLDDDHLVWVDAATAVITDLSGRVVRSVRLDLSDEDVDHAQWVGPVATDTARLAIGHVAFDLAGASPGARHPGPEITAFVPHVCGASEASTDPAVAVEGGAVILERGGSGPVVVADPRLGIDCSLWAAEALRGPTHHSLSELLWGRHTAWFTWWWREVALGLVVVVTAGALLLRPRRRRRLASSA